MERDEGRVDQRSKRSNRHSPNQKSFPEPEQVRLGRHHDKLSFRRRQVQPRLRASDRSRQHDARAEENGWPQRVRHVSKRVGIDGVSRGAGSSVTPTNGGVV